MDRDRVGIINLFFSRILIDITRQGVNGGCKSKMPMIMERAPHLCFFPKTFLARQHPRGMRLRTGSWGPTSIVEVFNYIRGYFCCPHDAALPQQSRLESGGSPGIVLKPAEHIMSSSSNWNGSTTCRLLSFVGTPCE